MGLEEYRVVVAVALAMMLKDVFRIPPLLFVFLLLGATIFPVAVVRVKLGPTLASQTRFLPFSFLVDVYLLHLFLPSPQSVGSVR